MKDVNVLFRFAQLVVEAEEGKEGIAQGECKDRGYKENRIFFPLKPISLHTNIHNRSLLNICYVFGDVMLMPSLGVNIHYTSIYPNYTGFGVSQLPIPIPTPQDCSTNNLRNLYKGKL